MEVILLENISRLGKIGDVVNVRPGYGRNFLVPQEKAVRATKDNIKEFEARREALEKRDQEQKTTAQKQAKKLEGVAVKIVRQASEDGKLYGSISVRDVANALEEAGHEVERRLIDLSSTIKTLGKHEATVLLHSDVRVPIALHVVRSLESPLFDDEEKAHGVAEGDVRQDGADDEALSA